MCASGAITPHASTRRHREMKLGFFVQTAAALYLLLSPGQVGSQATSAQKSRSSENKSSQ